MNVIENENLININLFDTCLIDNKTKKEIYLLFPGRKNGAYYLNKFENYLKIYYQISLKDYCKKYLCVVWPRCPVSNEELNYKIGGKGLKVNRFRYHCIDKEHSEAFSKACEKFSIERKGNGNPMYGKEAWNKGKDKRNPKIRRMALLRLGTLTSEETKAKQSLAAKKRKIHGHTGRKHSKKTKRFLRKHTAGLWQRGVFNRVTSIHLKMREFLSSLALKEQFQEEYQVKYWSMDFAFPALKIAIECQGTYFHVDPRVYPNGPINAIQRRNFGRDKAKKKVCERDGWRILEAWETEINDGTFKEYIRNKLIEVELIKL